MFTVHMVRQKPDIDAHIATNPMTGNLHRARQHSSRIPERLALSMVPRVVEDVKLANLDD
jgi:hypothetical protein